jgi:anti-sigma regulatory factor (Ser/Thr protein kinase)
MATDPRLPTPDARRTANRLLDVLQSERIADGAAADRRPLSESGRTWSLRCAEWLFAAQPQSVPQARGLIAHSLHQLPDEPLEVVLLLASELMSNAVLHGTGSVGLRLGWDGESVRVEVTDQSPEVPAVQSLDHDALGGRGLLLVDGLSSDWGVLTGESGQGKTVWFTLHA